MHNNVSTELNKECYTLRCTRRTALVWCNFLSNQNQPGVLCASARCAGVRECVCVGVGHFLSLRLPRASQLTDEQTPAVAGREDAR